MEKREKTAGAAGEKAEEKARANLHYKDTVFRMLFLDKRRLLGLYNAVSGRSYTDSEKLRIVLLESAVYMGMRNDVAFIIDTRLCLFEHQATVNPNMPLRFLQYVSAEYEKLIVTNNLHRRGLVKVLNPHFVVFYNGAEKCAERQELRLSAAYEMQEEEPELELRVQVLNINEGFNEELKKACLTLKEYMQYVDRVRGYAEEMSIDEAVDECIREGILKDFLLQNKAEVKRMSIFEYNEEDVRQILREEAYKEGLEKGIEEGIEKGIEEGEKSGDLRRLISLICKKVKKNKTLGEVAEDLEEEISAIEPLYRAAEKFAPEYDPDEVFEQVKSV